MDFGADILMRDFDSFGNNNSEAKIVKCGIKSYIAGGFGCGGCCEGRGSGFAGLCEVEPVCVFLKEVVLEHVADFEEQFGVDGGTVEYLIDICAVAVEFSCEPHHRAFLRAEFAFD